MEREERSLLHPFVQITADSTCDLSPELIEQYHIVTTPLYVGLGDATYRDGVDIHPQTIFDAYDQRQVLAKTSAVNEMDYLHLFTHYAEQGREVVHITLSESMSSCYQNACLAAQKVSGVYVVDSANLSTGSGHLVLLAAQWAQQGMDGASIAKALEQARPRVDASFVLDTLTYLYKGGRCSALAAFGSNLLHLKPCIEVRDGAMGVGKKYRGSLEKCMVQYVKDRLRDPQSIDPGRLFITYTQGTPPSILHAVRQTVDACMHFDEILYTVAGSTISSHCGPNTLGILYLRKESETKAGF